MMMKKALCVIFTIALVLSFASCGARGATAEKASEGTVAPQRTPAEAVANEMTASEATKLADTLMQEALEIFWWYHSDMSDELGIDMEAETLKADGQEWQKVGKFATMAELKAATEAVFTLDFCKAHFYDKIEQYGKFKEIDGVLYHNGNVGGMGWIYELPKEYTVKTADKDKIVLTAVCDGLSLGTEDTVEYEFELNLVHEGSGWKLASYYTHTKDGYAGDLLVRDAAKVDEAEIKNIANAISGAGMLGSTWNEPWSEESVYDLSFIRFYCMMNPDYTAEIPAEDFELFIHSCFDISTENIRKISDYNADKKVYAVSVDVSVPMMQKQADDYFKIDSITQENGKIKVAYRTIWGAMAASGDGSDTAFAGIITLRRRGYYYAVEAVNVTEDNSKKYD